jgi:hypothetical protein
MYQGTVGRLLNHSENCQVRKVVSLLTEALRQSQRADQRPQGDYAENQRVCAELRVESIRARKLLVTSPITAPPSLSPKARLLPRGRRLANKEPLKYLAPIDLRNTL